MRDVALFGQEPGRNGFAIGITSDDGYTAVLEVRNRSYAFGAKMALDEVNPRLDGGQFKALLGPNGAGKATLFSLLTRLYESRDRSIAVVGRDLRRHPGEALSRMGVVFQQPTLDLDLTVRQNILYYASLHGLDRRSALRRMEIELGRLDMAERTAETVRKLNGGHRRRVKIARAPLHRPTLLLLDEPTVGLDVPSRRAIVALAHRLAREDRVAVLWAPHLNDEVEKTDAVVVLHRGRVKADGGRAEVLAAAGAATIGEAFDRLTAPETP